jgi:hypothetical protein
MATPQPAESAGGDDDIANWMTQRWQDVQNLGSQAETAGRNLWAQATQAGQNLSAPNPSDIAAPGADFLKGNSSPAGLLGAYPVDANDLADPNSPNANPFSPSPGVSSLADLRKQQAQFGQVRNGLDAQNSWMAWPTLLPAAVGLGAAAAPALGMGGGDAAANYAATDFPELEAWQTQLEKHLGRPLTEGEKTALRAAARAKWQQANGVRASALGAQVHHDDPLEWAHIKPEADPNRLSSLVGLSESGHGLANRAWASFSRALGGRSPTPAEIMAQKLSVNRAVEPYSIRPGLPRPPPKAPAGGAQ